MESGKTKPMTAKPATNPASPTPADLPTPDYDALAANTARLMEEMGRATAASLRPIERGEIKPAGAEETSDLVRTLGAVVERFVTDPQRMILAQTELTKDLYDNHVSAQKASYYKKMSLMDKAMKASFHPDMTWYRPEGGLFILAKLPEGMDSLPFVNEAVKRKVITVPGSAFLTNQEDRSNAIRLNFSLPSEEDIEKGIEILGQLSHSVLG